MFLFNFPIRASVIVKIIIQYFKTIVFIFVVVLFQIYFSTIHHSFYHVFILLSIIINQKHISFQTYSTYYISHIIISQNQKIKTYNTNIQIIKNIIIINVEFKRICIKIHLEIKQYISTSIHCWFTIVKTDKQTGPFKKIQSAIDAAQPNSLIRVAQGFYQENLIIKYFWDLCRKPLIIQPKQADNNAQKMGVVLLTQSGIGIHINLPYSQNQVSLSGFKVSHTGNTADLQMKLIQHQDIVSIFEQERNQSEQLEYEYLSRVTFNKIQNMMMFVEIGKVNVSNCVFSLKYLVKSCKMMIPGICVDREGTLNLNNSQVKGNQRKDTIGIICKLGTLHVKNCVVTDHREGGILTWGGKENTSKVIRSKIQRNSVGIHVMGVQYKLQLCQNQINYNKIGIKVGLASQVQISRNSICENGSGIEIFSSFPLIYLNKINQNKGNGIAVHSHKKMICEAKIKKNISITGNGENGILVQGENNKSKVVENYLIGFNLQAGIRVAKDASPLILKNKIYKNFNQGILVTEDANAVIEKNLISHNVECNVALGGATSHHTLIAQNSIKSSQGAGINIIEGICNISRNDITENMQGIRMVESLGRIRRNFIANNANNGIVCNGQCNPTLVDNLITRNWAIGLFLREDVGLEAQPTIYSNIIVSNEINVGLEFRNENIVTALKSSNTIEGLIEEPKGISCAIM